MQKLMLLYWGTVFLMYLSQVYYPAEVQLQGHQIGKCHFMRKKSDVFMIIIIFWLSSFGFLRTSYNDTETYITVINNSNDDKQAIFDTIATELITGTTNDNFTVTAYGAAIFKVANGATLEI